MSMESRVMFRGALPAKAAVNAALRELGFPFSISGRGSLEGHRGFMPMKLRREETGVEFDVFDDAELLEQFAGSIDPAFDRNASLRWGGDETQMLAGLCVAAALARVLNASVFDEAEEALVDAEGAAAIARKNLQAVADSLAAEKERGRTRGTRPADIRHYLKPLLKMRPDLALVDRSLVVRPVRHVLRGAFFHASDRYSFDVHRLRVPLCNPNHDLVEDDRLRGCWNVWEDHFQPVLMDLLEEQVFGVVGQVTSLSAFAQDLASRPEELRSTAQIKAPVRAFLLAGEPERAAAYIESLEQKGEHPSYIKAMRAELDQDTGDLCAEQHEREAQMVAALKLQSVWEPAPFPVEVPKASRAAQCDEAPFSRMPWPAVPAGLFAEEPDGIGDARFSEGWLERQGRAMLLVPLTEEEAERRHLAREDYRLTLRPAEGHKLVVRYNGRKPNCPYGNPDPSHVPTLNVYLTLTTPTLTFDIQFREDYEARGQLRHIRAEVFDRTARAEIWKSDLDARKGQLEHRDEQNGAGWVEVAVGDEEMAPHLGIDFVFGDFQSLLRRADAYLRWAGFGPLPDVSEANPELG